MTTTDHPLFDALPLPPRPEMERAYLKGGASYDGVFYLAVMHCPRTEAGERRVLQLHQGRDVRGISRLPQVPSTRRRR